MAGSRHKEYVRLLHTVAIFVALLFCQLGFSCAQELAVLSGDSSDPLATDFFKPMTRILIDELRAQGFDLPYNLGLEDVIQKQLSLRYRRLPVKPWTVQRSEALKNRVLPPEISRGLKNFTQKARRGDDLLPHMSRRMTDLDYSDKLFSDWRIYHFHLGTKVPRGDKFIERTNELAFAYIHGDVLYLIDVQPHGPSFSDINLLTTIYEEQPDFLQPYVLSGLSISKTLNNQSGNSPSVPISKLRKFNLNAPIEMPDGKILMSPGGGLSLDGSSSQTVRDHTILISWLPEMQRWFFANEARWRRMLETEGGPITSPEPLRFRLYNFTPFKEITVREETTGKTLTIPLAGETH